MSALTASLQHRRDDSAGNSSNNKQSHTHHSSLSRSNSNSAEHDPAELQADVDTLYDGLIQQIDADKAAESKAKYKTTGFVILSFKEAVLKSYGTLADTHSDPVQQTIQTLTSMIRSTDQLLTYNTGNQYIDDNVERVTVKVGDNLYSVGRAAKLLLITQLGKK